VGSVEGTAAGDPQGGVETAHGAAGRRVLVSFAAGIAAFAIAWLATPWQAAWLIGWNVAGIITDAPDRLRSRLRPDEDEDTSE